MAITDNIVSYWRLAEASGNALDATGSNTLTETNGPIVSVTGKVGNARSFTAASTQYFTKADNASLSVGDTSFWISAWVKIGTKPVSTATIASKWTGVSNLEYILYYQGSLGGDKFSFLISRDGTAATLVGTTAATFGTLTAGVWYNVVAWFDSTNNLIGIGINGGTADTTTVADGFGPFDGTSAFSIGATADAANAFDGAIDEVGFWKGAAPTDQNRTDIYNGGSGLGLFSRVAATYYFANAGSDSNDGLTTSTPFQTISKANSLKVSAGDVFSFNKGDTFTGGPIVLALDTIGIPPNSLATLTVSGYGSGSLPIISGGDSSGITGHNLAYLTITGLEVIGSGVTLNAGSPNTITTTNAGIGIYCKNTTIANLSGLTITGCTVHGFAGSGIIVGSVEENPSFGYTDPTITGNTVYETASVGIGIRSLSSFSSIHVNGIISGNTTYNNYGDGVQNTGYGIQVLACTGTVCSGNIVRDNGQAAGPLAVGAPAGIMLAGAVNCIVRGNVVARQYRNGNATDGMGIDLDGNGNSGNLVEDNYITGCQGEGITCLAIGGTGTTNSTIRFNVSEDCLAAVRFDGATNTIQHNNTYYQTASGVLLNMASEGTGGKNYNNVFITGAGTTLGTAHTSLFNGNLYDTASFSLTYNSNVRASLAAFRAGDSQETATGFQTSAGLTSAGNGPANPPAATSVTAYDPALALSAVVGTGLDISGLYSVNPGTLDFHRLTNQPGGLFSIGAVTSAAAASSGASHGARMRRLLRP